MLIVFDIIAAFAALTAAWFWFASTRTLPPPTYGYGTMAPEDWEANPSPAYEWARKNSIQNRRAAIASGISALCFALSLFADLIASGVF